MKNIELNKGELNSLEGIIINHISNYTKDVPDSTLQNDIDLYNKITGENLTVEYVRINFIND